MTVAHVIPNYEELPPPLADAPRHNGSGRHIEHSDIDAERALISCALFHADPPPPLAPEAFVGPGHAAIWSAIADVHLAGNRPDAITVAAACEHAHAHVDITTLADLQAVPLAYPSNAARYAEIVEAHAARRTARSALEAASEHIRLGLDPRTVLAGLGDALPAPAATESLFADAQAALDGEDIFVIPDLGPRDDGATCLLYRPGINWLSGEPGKVKTLLAQWWTHKELVRGNTVVYLDFEGTLQSLVSRLRQMGAVDVTGLRYVKHEGPWSPAELAQLRDTFRDEQPSLVVVDAVAGAMESEHLNPEDNQEVERWIASIPTFAHHYGAAVLCVDHVVKQADARGRYPIGAQRKLARADLAYSLRMIQDPGVGITGYGQLTVAKDRHGALAEHTVSSVVAEIGIVSAAQHDDTYLLGVALSAPAAGVAGEPKGNEPTWYMEKVSRALEHSRDPLTKTQLRALIGKHAKYVDQAIELLLMQRHIVEVDVPGKSRPYRSVVAYRQPVTFTPPPVDVRYEKDTNDWGDG